MTRQRNRAESGNIMYAFARPASISLFVLTLPLSAAFADQALPPAGPMAVHDVKVEIDPTSGQMTILSQSSLNGAAMIFDPAEWLHSVEVSRGDEPFIRSEHLPLSIPIDADTDIIMIRSEGAIPELEDEQLNAGVTPDGIFLFDYDDWLPTTPDTVSHYHLTIKVPADHRAVSTGGFVSERIGEEMYEARFIVEAVGNGPSIFVGPYTIEERLQGDLRLRTYFHPESEHLADAYLDATESYLKRYASQIGSYPYDGFSVVSAPIPVGLGFNSLTYVSKDILRHDYMRGRSLAHEVLHSWWGNGVRIDYEAGNWAEGLTTYQADYALVEDQGGDAARDMRLEWLRNLSALSPEMDVPVRDFRSTSHDGNQAIGYDKVAMIFHMLRNKLGDELFQNGIRTFWENNRSKRAGWSDIQVAFEQTAASSLETFFDQWVDRSGLPKISLTNVAVRDVADGHQIELSLAQASPAYDLHLPVRIETAYTVETIYLNMTETSQSFTIGSATYPRAVAIDPDFDIARQLVAGEQVPIFRDVFASLDQAVMIASEQADIHEAAYDLASRLFRGEIDVVPSGHFNTDAHPLVVIGLTEDVAQQAEAYLTNPEPLRRMGTARAWTAAREDAAPYLFVSADDVDILTASFDALRFYGNRSFLVFDAGELKDVGVWSSDTSALTVRFD